MNKKHVGNRASNYIRSKGRIVAVQGLKSDSSYELLRKFSPEKDPCVPPKWLTQHLYVDGVENDGELPDKKKLHDLLDYMVDYVGSWTGCDDAYSAQQMKDILPLLIRCKLILEVKRMH